MCPQRLFVKTIFPMAPNGRQFHVQLQLMLLNPASNPTDYIVKVCTIYQHVFVQIKVVNCIQP